MITRDMTRVLMKEVAGLPQFDTGHTLEIRNDAGANVCTATEVTDGNYSFTWTAVNAYGYFYIDGSVKTAWGHQWLGEVTGNINLEGQFEIDAPAIVKGSLNVSGSTTLATSLNGIVRAASGVISAGQLIADADVSSSAAIAWSKINKSGSNLTDIATRSHTVLSDIGSNTHPQIDSHIADVTGGVHGATAVNSANMIVRRDASGRFSMGDLSASSGMFIGDVTSRGASWSGPGDAATLYLGETSNYLRMNWGGNMVLFANGQTNGVQLKFSHDWLGIGIDPTVPLDVQGAALIRGNATISGTATVSGAAHITGNTSLDGNVTLADQKYIRNGFSAYGWTGTGAGYTLEQNVSGSGKSYLEIDSLRVRGEMDVYELIINQIRATNGSMWISDVAKVEAVTGAGDVQITFVDPSGANVQPFAVNDLVMAQVWNNDFSGSVSGSVGHTVVRQVQGVVTTLNVFGNSREILVVYSSADHFKTGDTVVRVGNLSSSARQNSIYLTADDIGNPYIDILAGVNSFSWGSNIKARLGNLAGIADTINGQSASGFGLYSQNAFLKGGIVATFGKIGGWSINSDSINSTTVYGPTSGSSSSIGIYAAGASSFFGPGAGAMMPAIRMWNYHGGGPANAQVVLGQMMSGSTWISASGFAVWPDYASAPAFIMSFPDGGGTPDMRIAGWNFDTATLSSSGSTGGGNAVPSTTGIVINSAGWIAAPGFALGTVSGSIAGFTFDTKKQYIGTTNGSGLHQLYTSISSSSTGNWYEPGSYLEGHAFKWWTAFNAGQIVLGRMMGDGQSALKIHPSSSGSVYGIQMMDFRGNEFFALGADATTASFNGQDTLAYCRIAGWGFDFSKFSSSGNVGGSDGGFTTSGIVMNKAGWISAPAFALGTSTSKVAGWGFNPSQLSSSGSTGGSDGVPTTSGIILNSAGWLAGPGFALGTLSSSIAGWNFDTTKLYGVGSKYTILAKSGNVLQAGASDNSGTGATLILNEEGSIKAGTITGRHIEINTSGHTNEVAFFNENNTLTGRIFGEHVGSIDYFSIYGNGSSVTRFVSSPGGYYFGDSLNIASGDAFTGTIITDHQVNLANPLHNNQFLIESVQVVAARKTGWVLSNQTMSSSSVRHFDLNTQAGINDVVRALAFDLMTHGLIGA